MKVLRSHSEQEIKRIQKILEKIEAMRPVMKELSDGALRAKTAEFRKRLKKESLEKLLPEAFAAMREADRRVLGMEPFPVQLLGGIIMSQGRVAEMRTGEGKTLVCTLPCYLHALEGKGVHVVTVNDYLSKRDCELMRPAYEFMGLTCGSIVQENRPEQRKTEYAKDITYITNTELGFDYLRDHMAKRKSQIVQRGLHFCIIDEVDSVLIDEARTPLIISGSRKLSAESYREFDRAAKQMEPGETEEMTKIDYLAGMEREESGDYIIEEKEKNIFFTEKGTHKIEKMFGVENLSDPKNIRILHGMDMALRANALMHKDQDYVVREDQVLIVDEFTGRILEGRRFSDGLHQALEAKEHVTIHPENRTLATISFQSFFNKYEKKCGMTGTAGTAEQEFRDIYGMDVVTIPTNRPVIRKDLEDQVYKTLREKYLAVIKAVVKSHKKGQPVLLGTTTIDVSEGLSSLLEHLNIRHQVLNAKNPEQEAKIVAEAGKFGAVTIATNMAGRGTDIKLDERAREVGGLFVIGTERHESRRIDDQLRGRAGRQGDPGKSRFYLSLEDRLLSVFGGENELMLFQNLETEDCEPLEHRMLTKMIEKAQKRVEEDHFASRKQMLSYDQVNNDQREIIYAERSKVLEGVDIGEEIQKMIRTVIERKIKNWRENGENSAEELSREIQSVIPMADITDEEIRKSGWEEKAYDRAQLLYQKNEEQMEKAYPGEQMMRRMERMILLKVVDANWMEQIDAMEQLRQGIHLVSYGQKDPKTEYRLMGFQMFDEMNLRIQEETVRLLYQAAPTEE